MIRAAVLDLIRDDVASAANIIESISRRVGRAVTEREVRDALCSLQVAGLVSIAIVSGSTQEFAAATCEDIMSGMELWFRIVGKKA